MWSRFVGLGDDLQWSFNRKMIKMGCEHEKTKGIVHYNEHYNDGSSCIFNQFDPERFIH